MNKFNPLYPPTFKLKEPKAVFDYPVEVFKMQIQDGDSLPIIEENVKYYFQKDYYDRGYDIYLVGYIEEGQENQNYKSELRSYKRQLKKHTAELEAWNIEKEKYDISQARKKKKDDLKLLAALKAKYENR